MSTSFIHDLPRASRVSFLLRAAATGMLLTCISAGALAQEVSSGPLGVQPLPRVSASPTADEVTVAARIAGSVCGTVKDMSGATIAGAVVTLATENPAGTKTAETNGDGVFLFAGVPSGAYRLTVAESGFDVWARAGSLGWGESLNLSEIALSLAAAKAEMEVVASKTEVAEAQMELAEKQRVLGVFPDFYTSYVWDAAPLSSRQKYRLAWRFAVDPVAFAMAGAIAGTEQSENGFSGYGQGVRGYARRFGATYTDGFASTLLGQAILPSIFHQDPRYFVKGTGTVRARVGYALATTVMCRGDNGRWQVNYSNILGNVASAGLSNAYYPASNRHGAMLTIQNSLVTTASGAIGGLIQEFMLRRMTPHVPDYGARQ